jgi:hypothetical protein
MRPLPQLAAGLPLNLAAGRLGHAPERNHEDRVGRDLVLVEDRPPDRLKRLRHVVVPVAALHFAYHDEPLLAIDIDCECRATGGAKRAVAFLRRRFDVAGVVILPRMMMTSFTRPVT